MADVTMPRLSDTMEEGTIASWLKKPGEKVDRGEVIAQIETDKATMDLTAFEAGTLQEILAPEGSTVAIGQPVARIGSGNGSAKASPPPRLSRPRARRFRAMAKRARRRWPAISPPNMASTSGVSAAVVPRAVSSV